jgi:hypothetical protein
VFGGNDWYLLSLSPALQSIPITITMDGGIVMAIPVVCLANRVAEARGSIFRVPMP